MIYFDLAAFKASVAVVVVSTAVQAFQVPFFAVSYSTVGMAVAGSLLAFVYGPPVESRKHLYGYALGGIFIGIWGLKLLQWWGVNIPADSEGVFAGVIALISQRIVPVFVDNLPAIAKRLTKTDKTDA